MGIENSSLLPSGYWKQEETDEVFHSSELDLLPVILHWFCNLMASKQNHTRHPPQSVSDSQPLLTTTRLKASIWWGLLSRDGERKSSDWWIGAMMDLWAARSRDHLLSPHFYYPIRSDVGAVIHDGLSHFKDLAVNVSDDFKFLSNWREIVSVNMFQRAALSLPPASHLEWSWV